MQGCGGLLPERSPDTEARWYSLVAGPVTVQTEESHGQQVEQVQGPTKFNGIYEGGEKRLNM